MVRLLAFPIEKPKLKQTRPKYWKVEKLIAYMQEEICHIQGEFDAHAAIEGDESRALMMIIALRSCQGMVAKLVESFEELIRIATM